MFRPKDWSALHVPARLGSEDALELWDGTRSSRIESRASRPPICDWATPINETSLENMMRAAIFRHGDIVVGAIPDPIPLEGQVLVKTLFCGICGMPQNTCVSSSMLAIVQGGAGRWIRIAMWYLATNSAVRWSNTGPEAERV
jgi:hypothetical protein